MNNKTQHMLRLSCYNRIVIVDYLINCYFWLLNTIKLIIAHLFDIILIH